MAFENLRINALISDDMPGKSGHFKDSDMARIFEGEHVEELAFREGAVASATGTGQVHEHDIHDRRGKGK